MAFLRTHGTLSNPATRPQVSEGSSVFLPVRAAASRDVHETYMRSGFGPGMARFIALVSHKGPIPADYGDQPAPEPAMYGLPGGR